MSFDSLGLSEKVLQAVHAVGFDTPTPIQAQAIPHVLARRDVLGIAQTGTGKTAAFTLPMLTLLEMGRAKARMPRTLILEPTRELAAQVEEAFGSLGQQHKITMALLIGGVSFDDQDAKLSRGVDVLVATPGRLLDHFERGKLLLNGIEILVIDEADRMLDMGFIPDIERICRLIPMTRQTLFFSATMPPEIQRLVDTFLHQPVRIEVSKPATAASTVTQQAIATGSEPPDKRRVLRNLIRNVEGFKNAIVFCNRKREVAVLWRSLVKHGFNATALHGDMDQRARMASLDAFRSGEVSLLVASDVAARGLDIPDVSHIFNYDVPHHAEDYIHRIGRTGRAGRSGTAVMLVSPLDSKAVAAIEKMLSAKVPWIGEPPGEAPDAATGREGRRGHGRDRRHEGRQPNSERNAKPRPKRPAPEMDAAPAPERRPPPAAAPERRPLPAAAPERRPPTAAPEQRRPSTAAPEQRRRPAEPTADADTSAFLPAFLLRPTRIKTE